MHDIAHNTSYTRWHRACNSLIWRWGWEIVFCAIPLSLPFFLSLSLSLSRSRSLQILTCILLFEIILFLWSTFGNCIHFVSSSLHVTCRFWKDLLSVYILACFRFFIYDSCYLCYCFSLSLVSALKPITFSFNIGVGFPTYGLYKAPSWLEEILHST